MFYRLGLATVRYRAWILGFWLLCAAVALPFAPQAPGALAPGGFSDNSMQSQQAVNALQAGLHTSFDNALVFFTSKTLTATDPKFIAEANTVVAPLQHWSEVQNVVPFSLNPAQISHTGHAAYTVVFLKATPDNAPKYLPGLRARLGNAPDLTVTLGGGPVFYADIQSVSEADLRRAEELAFPFALVALLIVFGSVVSAALPAIIGGFSVVISLALLFALARAAPVSVFALNITTLFGLGLGVDYSLFMVSRFREEIARGHPVPEAIARTMSTAGRAVFFSGLAVSIGLFGLVVFPLNMLRSVGIGGIITVALAILAAVTLLPALLSILGERVNALPVRLPWQRRRGQLGTITTTRAAEETGFWHRLASGVMAHPLQVFFPVLAFLLLLGVPYLSVRLAAPDASILPASVKSRAAYDLLQSQFNANEQSPIVIAVQTQGSPLTSANLDALGTYVRRLQADPRVADVQSIVTIDPRISFEQYKLMYANPQLIADPFISTALHAEVGKNIEMVQVVSKYSMLDKRSEALVEAIRNTTPPGGLHVLVDGGTAGIIDYVNTLYGDFPKALLLVAGITFLVLMVLFRSLVLPLKAILMNGLSIAASYGALVFIFQEGHFSNILNFTPLGFVEASTPILLFCALFGLSMDYEVFLLTRIREAYEQTGDNTRAIAIGMERSGSIITSAAAIVILVSLSFASADLVIVKALGVGMALAVLIDATLVRGLLVPATMRLLGNINWWWPWPFNRLLPGTVFHETAVPASTESPREGDTRTPPVPVGGE